MNARSRETPWHRPGTRFVPIVARRDSGKRRVRAGSSSRLPPPLVLGAKGLAEDASPFFVGRAGVAYPVLYPAIDEGIDLPPTLIPVSRLYRFPVQPPPAGGATEPSARGACRLVGQTGRD